MKTRAALTLGIVPFEIRSMRFCKFFWGWSGACISPSCKFSRRKHKNWSGFSRTSYINWRGEPLNRGVFHYLCKGRVSRGLRLERRSAQNQNHQWRSRHHSIAHILQSRTDFPECTALPHLQQISYRVCSCIFGIVGLGASICPRQLQCLGPMLRWKLQVLHPSVEHEHRCGNLLVWQ